MNQRSRALIWFSFSLFYWFQRQTLYLLVENDVPGEALPRWMQRWSSCFWIQWIRENGNEMRCLCYNVNKIRFRPIPLYFYQNAWVLAFLTDTDSWRLLHTDIRYWVSEYNHIDTDTQYPIPDMLYVWTIILEYIIRLKYWSILVNYHTTC